VAVTPVSAARAVLADITGEFERIYTALEPLSAAFATIIEKRPRVNREDLAPLRPSIFAMLADHRDLVAGAGLITAPGLLADSVYWLEWWWTRASGTPEALRVNLDPAAPDFFDYASDDWYAAPMQTGLPHVSGPYVDYACTNQYALTVSVPVRVHDQLVGVAASDVLVASLEQRILPALRRLDPPLVLVNAAGRVVVSSAPDYAPGHLMTRGVGEPIALSGARTIGWRLLAVA